jgi:hypothetical protein
MLIMFSVPAPLVHVDNTHPEESCRQKAHPWTFCTPAPFEDQQILALLVVSINQQEMLLKKMTNCRTVDGFVHNISEIVLAVEYALRLMWCCFPTH